MKIILKKIFIDRKGELIHFPPMTAKLTKPCDNFQEDWAVCYDFGEPKGQCINCGFMDFEHTVKLVDEQPSETIETTVLFGKKTIKL